MTDSTTAQDLVITVYTKPNCVQCDATKRKLTQHGVIYDTVDVLEDPKTLEALKALGYMAAPVVMVSKGANIDEVHWAQYQPNKIDEHILEPLGLK